jgi:hypothetical protein
MTSLAEFLLACIAEDEASAPHEHRRDPEGDAGYYACPAARTEPLGDLPWGPDACDCGLDARRRRVLAECEAKRRIVEAAFVTAATIDGEWGCCHTSEQISAGVDEDGVPLPRDCYGPGTAKRFLRPLALPYADHPDYSPEWAV